MATMSTQQKDKSGYHNLYDDPFLSDVKVKFSGQQIHAHKFALITKCEYFFKAFSGGFPVAKSDEIDLGNDDDADAVLAAIRHLYDRPYDMLIKDEVTPDSGVTNDELLFHINVFTVADKYDIPTLRSLVVNRFKNLMETSWAEPQFAPAIKALCLPSASRLADGSLQAAAAKFCADHIGDLIQQVPFKEILQEEESFAGRLLVDTVGAMQPKIMGYICRSCEFFFKAATIVDIPGMCPVCGQNWVLEKRVANDAAAGVVDCLRAWFHLAQKPT